MVAALAIAELSCIGTTKFYAAVKLAWKLLRFFFCRSWTDI